MSFLNNRHMYIRISLLLLIIFTIIIIPLSLLLSNQFSKYAFSEINRFTQEKANDSIENIDFVLNRLWT